MKTKTFFLALIIFSLFNKTYLHAQGESMQQETIFSSRIKAPIVLDVRTDQNNIYFNVTNNSLFPYVFEVKFGDFQNLSPRVFDKTTTLLPGINRLFTFKIVDPNLPPVLSYHTRFYMTSTNSSIEKFKPYLVPIGKNKTVAFRTTQDESKKIYINQFMMNEGDTVFNARKGIVTALPDNMSEVDRITNNSLEIRHEDGTIAVYQGLNPDLEILKLKQQVYPSQPLGIIGSSKLLLFQLFEIQSEGKVTSFNIFYSGHDNQMIPSQNILGTKVTYPDQIIKKEMTKKEISKYEKNSLF